MSERRHRLIDCNPRWVHAHGETDDGLTHYVSFDCPEGHDGCSITVPFTPRLNGSAFDGAGGATWQRTGDTFETLSLSPSIAKRPRYATREVAIAAGCISEHVTEALLCACHIFITDGKIIFCSESH